MFLKAYRYILMAGVAVLILITALQFMLLVRIFRIHKTTDISTTVEFIESRITGHLELLRFVPHAPPYIRSLAWLIDELQSHPTLKGIAISDSNKILINTFPPKFFRTNKEILKKCHKGIDYKNAYYFCKYFNPIPHKSFFLLIAIDRSFEVNTRRQMAILSFGALALGLLIYGLFWHHMAKLVKQHGELENKLATSEKLAMIGKLSTMIAHEIRNPLNTISMSIQYMEETGQFRKDLLHSTKLEIKRLAELTSELLLLDKGFEFSMKLISLEDILTDILARFSLKFKARNTEFHVKTGDAKGSSLLCDRKWITRAFENVLRNALEATEAEDTVKFEVYNKGNKLLFIISDTGKGIDQDLKHKILEPFVTTKKTGFGLGLYIVKKVIEAHDGEIAIDSNCPRGTIVTITLPKA